MVLLVTPVAAVGCDPGERGEQAPSEPAAEGESPGFFERMRRRLEPREPYALDDVSREVAAGAESEVECDRDSLEVYRGAELTYESPLHVHPAFGERLGRFEKIADEVARELYSREPRSIRHAGAFACRTVRGRESRLSEHALGNALDLVGFSFGRLPPAEEAAEGKGGSGEEGELPARLRRPFEVTVREHWDADPDDEVEVLHQRFLRTLAERLEEERVFRGMIGPSQSGHQRHLHLDVGPYRYIRL